jgi:hypothetical protein
LIWDLKFLHKLFLFKNNVEVFLDILVLQQAVNLLFRDLAMKPKFYNLYPFSNPKSKLKIPHKNYGKGEKN